MCFLRSYYKLTINYIYTLNLIKRMRINQFFLYQSGILVIIKK